MGEGGSGLGGGVERGGRLSTHFAGFSVYWTRMYFKCNRYDTRDMMSA